jgi:hypothetical protein
MISSAFSAQSYAFMRDLRWYNDKFRVSYYVAEGVCFSRLKA